MILKKFKFIIALAIVSILNPALAQRNTFEENVNVFDSALSYKNDFDTSKFRLKLMNSSYSKEIKTKKNNLRRSLASQIVNSESEICNAVKTKNKLDFSNTVNYVVSALKKAGSIPEDDKNYSLDSAHFFWEMYLSYRSFVDISKPIKKDGYFSLSNLPEASIVTLEKGCNPNGLVAIHCDGKFYAPKFVDIKRLESRLNASSDKECKLGKGFRVIAEAKRFL